MTKKDRTNLSILIVLLVVLGITILLVYRSNQPPTLAAPPQAPAKASTQANPPAATSATTGIRLDLVEKSGSSDEDVGKKNVFQYQQAHVAPVLRPGANTPNVTQPPVVTQPVQPPRAPVQTGPPPPPPILLKYQGFVAVSPPGAGMTAVLADDTRHYLVTVGEILMGKYRITAINATSLELEDLEFNRRQMLPLMK